MQRSDLHFLSSQPPPYVTSKTGETRRETRYFWSKKHATSLKFIDGNRLAPISRRQELAKYATISRAKTKKRSNHSRDHERLTKYKNNISEDVPSTFFVSPFGGTAKKQVWRRIILGLDTTALCIRLRAQSYRREIILSFQECSRNSENSLLKKGIYRPIFELFIGRN